MSKKQHFFQSVFKKKSILFTWVLSYILLILVQLGISTMSYMQVYQEVETEIEHYAQSKLNGLTKGMRAKADMIDKMLVGISLDSQVLKFLSTEAPIEGEKSYQMLQTMQNLKLYINGINFTDRVYVYFRASDMVITPQEALPSARYFERYVQPNEETLTYADWKDGLLAESEDAYQIRRRERDNREAILEFSQQLPISDRYHKTAVVGVQVRESVLLDVDNTQITDKETIYVIDENDHLICQYGQGEVQRAIHYSDMTESEGAFYHEVDGDKQVEIYADVGVRNWKMVSGMRANVFWNKLARVRNISILSMTLVICLQLVIAYYFMRKNYDPLKELIHAIAENSGEEYSGSKNEYYYIRDTMKDLLKEKTYIAKTLKQQKGNMKTDAMIKLLKGKYESDAQAQAALEEVGITLGSGDFVVVAFSNEDISELFSEEPDVSEVERFRLSQYILANVVEDLSGQIATGHVVEIEDLVFCLLEVAPDAPRGWKETARTLATAVCDATKQHLQLETIAAYGTGYRAIGRIRSSYSEAVEAMEYKQIMEVAGYPCYEDINEATGTQLYHYSLQEEQNLIEAVQDGDYERAQFVLNKVFQSNFEGTQHSVSIVKCFMMDVVSTLLRAVNELSLSSGKTQEFGDLKSVHALLECGSVKQLWQEADALLRQICGQVKETNETNTKSIWKEVSEFIHQHYMDSNLNVSYLGEQFSMAPSYLSKLFKAQTGQSVLDYIHQLRIEQAKQLLVEQPDATMEQIAAAVGYSGRITFSRLFKKFVGVTPGVYKETRGKK